MKDAETKTSSAGATARFLGRIAQFFADLSLRNKILMPVLGCLLILSVVLMVNNVKAFREVQDRTLPLEREVQKLRGDSALLSSASREYIMTRESSTHNRIRLIRSSLSSSLERIENQIPGNSDLLMAAGDGLMTASQQVTRLRDEIQELLDHMDAIEVIGRVIWQNIETKFSEENSEDWIGANQIRASTALFDLGNAAEFYHLAIMRSVWVTRDESDLNPDQNNEHIMRHHSYRARSSLLDLLNKLQSILPKTLQLDYLTIDSLIHAFVNSGNQIVISSAELWAEMYKLEAAEADFDAMLAIASKAMEQETNRVFQKELLTTLVLLSGAVFLLALVIWFFTGRVSVAVEDLVHATSKLGISNLSHRVKVTRKDEVGELASAFNTMASELERSITELHTVEEVALLREREVAHEAGKAEVSTAILHNVGNILNSVMISCQMIEESVSKSSKLAVLRRANENLDTLKDELTGMGEVGARLATFYPRFEGLLEKEDEKLVDHVKRISTKVALIRDVIRSQQGFAKGGLQMELLDPRKMVEDALVLVENDLINRGVIVEKHFGETPRVMIQRSKLAHILINVFRNARDSMIDGEKRLILSTDQDDDNVYIRVRDTGRGIPRENLKKVFQHGFSTKADGHGFGLHASANSMAEMNGGMWAESEGVGQGATFVLRFPLGHIEDSEA